MNSVPHVCVTCGEATDGGQLYRFHFGVVVDDESDTTFQSMGSDEAYYCDRCVLLAALREETLRAGFFLVLGLFSIVVVVYLVSAASPSVWASLVALVVVAVLGGAAFRRWRRLHVVLNGDDPARLRDAVRSNENLQDMGDVWAIARRRQALQNEGAELFLTRNEYRIWSRPRIENE